MINPTWIREKLLSSKKYWSKLKEIISKTPEDLEKDLDLQLKAERIFEILSQILLDICTHIIARTNEPPPKTYSDCMKKLGEFGIITPRTAEKITQLVKMRNFIVHQYGKINYQFLFKGLCDLNEDFPQFQEEILKWVDTNEKNV